MKPILVIACLPLLVGSCTLESRRSQTCYETTPYDYSNLPTAQKGEAVPSVASYGNCPANVAEVLMRDRRCGWWHASSNAGAARWLKDLRCDGIDDEMLRLKQQYSHDPAILRTLDNAVLRAGI